MDKKGTKIAIFFLGLVIAAFFIGYRMWNKPHANVADAKAEVVDAVSFYKLFSQDSATAKMQYQEKVVEVTGTVHGQAVNQQEQQVITLETALPGAYINCTMEVKMEKADSGSAVTLKGICSGIGQGDADMGIPGDVYLNRCYPVNKP
jgi:hypothetical protein